MQEDFFKDLYAILIADATIQSIFSPATPRARFNLANQDEIHPFIVYGGKFNYDDTEMFASGNAFITIDVYDFRTNGSRGLQLVNAIKNVLNRNLFQNATKYRVLRWFLASQANIPTGREDITREELIFRCRFYDESLSRQVT